MKKLAIQRLKTFMESMLIVKNFLIVVLILTEFLQILLKTHEKLTSGQKSWALEIYLL